MRAVPREPDACVRALGRLIHPQSRFMQGARARIKRMIRSRLERGPIRFESFLKAGRRLRTRRGRDAHVERGAAALHGRHRAHPGRLSRCIARKVLQDTEGCVASSEVAYSSVLTNIPSSTVQMWEGIVVTATEHDGRQICFWSYDDPCNVFPTLFFDVFVDAFFVVPPHFPNLPFTPDEVTSIYA